jgi:hypothetical protein
VTEGKNPEGQMSVANVLNYVGVGTGAILHTHHSHKLCSKRSGGLSTYRKALFYIEPPR